MSGITTHVLDTAKGRPGSGIKVILEFHNEGAWEEIASGQTNFDGRLTDLLTAAYHLTAGTYRLTFDTQSYYAANDEAGFYPHVTVSFEVKDPTQHYHVPLLLSPFGYSTYRGS
jgi:5-hydroxyisourate hydrolase